MFKRIFEIYKNHKLNVALQLGIIFLMQSLSMVNPYVFGKITDSIVTRQGLRTAITLASILLLFDGARYILGRIRNKISNELVWFPIQEYLRFKTLSSYLNFSIGQHKNHHSGINADITSKGEEALQRLANTIVTYYLPLFIQVIITITILLWLHLPLGAVICFGLLVYGVGQWRMEKKYSPRINESRDVSLESSNYRTDLMRAVVLIKSHGKEKWVQEKYKLKYLHSVRLNKKLNFYISKWDGALSLIVDITEYLAMVIGIVMISRGNLTLGELLTARIWWGQACSMVGQIGERYQLTLEQVSSIKKFFGLIDTPPTIKEIENPIHLGGITGAIEFKEITFRYPSLNDSVGKDVLKNISLTVNVGERVAIVGPSGCGKTTLITLLQRGYDPNNGTIQIGGYHLRDLALNDYNRHIAVVDQASLMIDGTLRDNILLGAHRPLTDEEILKFCELAELDISEFSSGLEHNVGQEGKKISGGQRQRVAIARAIAGDPKILILDEATASLDGIAEAKIQRALTNASRGRTIIMIAHRISTIQNADRIFVMENGEILTVGTHKELMASCKLYAELAMSQMIDVVIDERLAEQ